ncbi:MAG TPA: hypothetical protein VFG11_06635, partial [Acidobacteriota bacterium]|nr:hypothetical protein [Acidobacteriota bacterium]
MIKIMSNSVGPTIEETQIKSAGDTPEQPGKLQGATEGLKDELSPFRANNFEKLVLTPDTTKILANDPTQLAVDPMSEASIQGLLQKMDPNQLKDLGAAVREGLTNAGLPSNLADRLFGQNGSNTTDTLKNLHDSNQGSASDSQSNPVDNQPNLGSGLLGTGIDAPGFSEGPNLANFRSAADFMISITGDERDGGVDGTEPINKNERDQLRELDKQEEQERNRNRDGGTSGKGMPRIDDGGFDPNAGSGLQNVGVGGAVDPVDEGK